LIRNSDAWSKDFTCSEPNPTSAFCILHPTSHLLERLYCQHWKKNILWNVLYINVGHAVVQWLRHCATNRQVTGSIPDGVIGIFHWNNPSGRNLALGSINLLATKFF
jgi:hypothetical protein